MGTPTAVAAPGSVHERRSVRLVSLLREPAFWLSAAISATMFSGNWQLTGVPLPLDRVFFGLTFATIALRMPIGGRFRLRLRGVHVAMIAALAYVIESAIVSATITSHDGVFGLLDRFGLVPFAAFMVAPVVFRSDLDRTVLLTVLTVTGAYLALTTLFETVHANALVFPRYIVSQDPLTDAGRPGGPFLQAGANGMAMTFCAVAATVLARQARRWLARTACLTVALLCLAGILFTLTRATWLGAAVGGVATLAFYRPLRKYLPPVVIAGGAVVAIALAAVPSLATSVQTRADTNLTLWARYNLNNAAVNMAEAHPLFGVGWGEFAAKADHYYQLGKTYPLVTATVVHNVLLSNLAELGLIGVTLWLTALVLGLGGALSARPPPNLRTWQYGLMAVVIDWVICASFGPLPFAFANTSLWVWAGIVYGRTACPVVLAAS